MFGPAEGRGESSNASYFVSRKASRSRGDEWKPYRNADSAARLIKLTTGQAHGQHRGTWLYPIKRHATRSATRVSLACRTVRARRCTADLDAGFSGTDPGEKAQRDRPPATGTVVLACRTSFPTPHLQGFEDCDVLQNRRREGGQLTIASAEDAQCFPERRTRPRAPVACARELQEDSPRPTSTGSCDMTGGCISGNSIALSSSARSCIAYAAKETDDTACSKNRREEPIAKKPSALMVACAGRKRCQSFIPAYSCVADCTLSQVVRISCR